MSIALAVIITVIVMTVGVILVNNLLPTERKIKHHLPHSYAVADPQFIRTPVPQLPSCRPPSMTTG